MYTILKLQIYVHYSYKDSPLLEIQIYVKRLSVAHE